MYVERPHGEYAGKERDRRRDVEDEFLESLDRIDEAREVAEPLLKAQAAHEEGIRLEEDLPPAEAPAAPLYVEGQNRLGGDPVGELLVVVDARPALRLEPDRCHHVLGDRAGRESLDVVDRLPPHQCAAPYEVGGVPVIPPRLYQVVEESLLPPDVPFLLVDTVHEGIDVVEGLRRLHEGDLVVLEVADDPVDEVGERRVVGVEYRDELGRRELEPVVDVARLGVVVRRPCDVDASELTAELLDLGPLAVVQYERPVRIGEVVAGEERLAQHRDALVVGRDQHVDRAPLERRRRRAALRPPDREVEEYRRDESEELGDPEGPGEDEGIGIKGLRHPPEEVVDRDGYRDDGDNPAQVFRFPLRGAHCIGTAECVDPRMLQFTYRSVPIEKNSPL